MVFNARVINLRVYNAGHNVLRQQAALHFGPPVGKPEEEAAPPPQRTAAWAWAWRRTQIFCVVAPI